MDEQRQDNQLEPTHNSSVLIQDIASKTSCERWMIEMGGERRSGRSVLATFHDDDDDTYKFIFCAHSWMHVYMYIDSCIHTLICTCFQGNWLDFLSFLVPHFFIPLVSLLLYLSFSLSLYLYIYVYVCTYFGCVFVPAYTYACTLTCTSTYIFSSALGGFNVWENTCIPIHRCVSKLVSMCICLCVCVCM